MTEGNYILRETKAPMGYDIHPDMRVSLSHYGVLTVDGVVIMDDKVVLSEARTAYPLDVLKTDGNGAALAGAHLQIVDKSTGEAVDDWVSTDAAHQAKLAFGDYILREVEAPRGFEKIADVDFSVARNGEVSVQGDVARFSGDTLNAQGKREGGVLTVTNVKSPKPDKPSKPDKPNTPETPDTPDTPEPPEPNNPNTPGNDNPNTPGSNNPHTPGIEHPEKPDHDSKTPHGHVAKKTPSAKGGTSRPRAIATASSSSGSWPSPASQPAPQASPRARPSARSASDALHPF